MSESLNLVDTPNNDTLRQVSQFLKANCRFVTYYWESEQHMVICVYNSVVVVLEIQLVIQLLL